MATHEISSMTMEPPRSSSPALEPKVVVGTSSFTTQTFVLFKKQYLVNLRGWRSLLLQLLIPVLMVIMVKILTLTSSASFGPYGDTVRSPPVTSLNDIPFPKCNAKYYNKCFSLAVISGCNSFAGDGTNSVLQGILTDLKLNTAICSGSDPLSTPSSCDVYQVPYMDPSIDPQVVMDNFLYKYPNMTQIALVIAPYETASVPTSSPAPAPTSPNASKLQDMCPWSSSFFGINNGAKRYTVVYNETLWSTGGCALPFVGIPVPWQCLDSLKDLATPLIHAVNNNFIKTQVPGGSIFNLNAQTSYFPYPKATSPSVYGSTSFFLFLAAMFPLIVHLLAIVVEKENKLRLGMKSMGLRSGPYWLTWFIWNFTVLQLGLYLMYGIGAAMQIPFFLVNSFLTQLSAMVVGIAIIALFAIFQDVVTQVLYTTWLDVPDVVRVVFSLFSPLMFTKGIRDLTSSATNADSNGISWSNIGTSSSIWPIRTCWGFLLLNTIVYLFLAFYFDGWISTVTGPGEPWYYIFLPRYWCRGEGGLEILPETDEQLQSHTRPDDDPDVVVERARACKTLFNSLDNNNVDRSGRPAVLIRSLTKTYYTPSVKEGYSAVDDLNLAIEDHSLFCLLGPNGAGKTTTISILTGSLSATEGFASIKDRDVATQLSEIRRIVGVCPQFDIVWKELTGREHLILFATLKGVPAKLIELEADRRLKEVLLTVEEGNRIVGEYSGGMRRRLSVAMSFIGDPEVVFLDEPTTGMDPISRKQVWDVILQAKRGRCILLTTHSMEEADTLSDQIAIMALGRLRCIGSSVRLKNRFGAGYKVIVLLSDASPELFSRFSTSLLEQRNHSPDFSLYNVSQSSADKSVVISIPREHCEKLPSLISFIEFNKTSLGVLDFQISLSSLEDVFISISELTDSNEIEKKAAQMLIEGGDNPKTRRAVEDMRKQASNALSSTGLVEVPCLHCDGAVSIPEGIAEFECPLCHHSQISPNANASSPVVMSVIPEGCRHVKCKHCQGDMLVSFQDTMMSCPHCNEVDDVSVLPTVTSSIESNGVNVTSVTEDSSIVSVDRRYRPGKQFLAMTKKMVSFQLRQKGANCCQIGTVAFVLIVLVLVQVLIVNSLATTTTQPMQNEMSLPIDTWATWNGPLNKMSTSNLMNWSPRNLPAMTGYVTASIPPSPSSPNYTLFQNLTLYSLDQSFLNPWPLPPGQKRKASFPLPVKPYPFPDAITMKNSFFDDTNKSKDSNCRRNGNPNCPGVWYGGIDLSVAFTNANTMSYVVYYNISNNVYWGRIPALVGITERGAYQYQMVNRNANLIGATLDINIKRFPILGSTSTFDLVLLLGTFLFPLLFYIMFPIVAGSIVYERQNRLLEIIKMMGGKEVPYWLCNFLFYYFLYVLSLILAVIIAYAFKMRVFTANAPLMTILTILLWGLNMVGLAFVYQNLFSTQRSTIIVAYLIVFASVIVGYIVTPILDNTGESTIMNVYSIYPFFAFFRGIYYLSTSANPTSGVPITWSDLTYNGTYWKMTEVFIWLIAHNFWLYPLAYYLSQVLSQDYGVKKNLCFCFRCKDNENNKVYVESSPVGLSSEGSVEYNSCPTIQPPLLSSENIVRQYDSKLFEEGELDLTKPDHRLIPQLSYSDCVIERNRTFCQRNDSNTVVRVFDLYKVFPSKSSPAVHRLSLCIAKGELFCLLGANGAGKSTSINILTGLFPATSGSATIGGYSIETDMDAIHSSIGVCPQDNLLWDDLSPSEHLLFYGRLRNIPENALVLLVKEMLSAVLLSSRANHRVSELSGGMKRRLSIAISLLGCPSVSFLDEPTTGLDPATRRHVWQVIQSFRADKAIILTTHSMEEAEALSTRIGIMAQGSLRCIGTCGDLKSRFGFIYRISISATPGKVLEAESYVTRILPDCDELPSYRRGNVRQYEICRDKVNVGNLFEKMNEATALKIIDDWALSQASLEDVFQSIVRSDEG